MILIVANIFYFVVIALHLYFAVLEITLWKTKGPKVFGMTQQFADQSAALASNQGLYNLFLAIALIIGFLSPVPEIGASFMMYGLGCVIVAGIWGGVTVNLKIFFVQAVPAILALIFRLLQLA